MESSDSRSGSSHDQFWRDARNGGYFSYAMKTEGRTDLKLLVRYWGAEWGTRKFDIYIDEEKLITEDNTGRWNRSSLEDIQYDIPPSMLKDKKTVRVKFQSLPNTTAGAVYLIRLLRKE